MSYNPNDFGVTPLSRASGPDAENATGSSIPKGTPVRLTFAGMATVDPSVESQVDSIAGITNSAVSDSTTADIISAGLLEEITVSFAVGSAVYLGKDGFLTNTKPSIGSGGFVSGDFVVRMGVITKNVSNPAKKDMLVNIQIVGML